MKKTHKALILLLFLFLPTITQAEQWEPNIFTDLFPVSVMVVHYSDGLEVNGPTGDLRAIIFTINGQARFKEDKAKITVETTTPKGSIVSREYLFTAVGSGPLNVSFRIGDSDVQYDPLFAQLKNATSVHATVNNTDMRFDAEGLGTNFSVYTLQD